MFSILTISILPPLPGERDPFKQKKKLTEQKKKMIVSVVLMYMIVVWNVGEAANCACFNTVGPVVLGSAVNETDCQLGVCGSFGGHVYAPTWIIASGFYCSSPVFPPPLSSPSPIVIPVLRLNDTYMTYGMANGGPNGGGEGPMIASSSRRFLHSVVGGAQLIQTTLPSSSLVPESITMSLCVGDAIKAASPNCLVYAPNTALLGAASEAGCAQHAAWAGFGGSLFNPPITAPLGTATYPLCFDHPVLARVNIVDYTIVDSNDVPLQYNKAVIQDAQCSLVIDSPIWFGISTFSTLGSGELYGAYLANAEDPLDVTVFNLTVVGPITATSGGTSVSTLTSLPCGACPASPSPSSSSSGGALVGAVVGLAILAGCIAGCVWLCVRRRNKKKEMDDAASMHAAL